MARVVRSIRSGFSEELSQILWWRVIKKTPSADPHMYSSHMNKYTCKHRCTPHAHIDATYTGTRNKIHVIIKTEGKLTILRKKWRIEESLISLNKSILAK